MANQGLFQGRYKYKITFSKLLGVLMFVELIQTDRFLTPQVKPNLLTNTSHIPDLQYPSRDDHIINE